MAVRRVLAMQPDVLEWASGQRAALRVLRARRYALEKGFVAYFRDIRDFLRGRGGEDSKSSGDAVADAAATTAGVDKGARAMAQYYESEELIKRIKWKRVTWDDDADYASFARRVLDNVDLFKHTPAFSFMSVHVSKDPLMHACVQLPPARRTIEPLDLTAWVLREREPQPAQVYPLPPRPSNGTTESQPQRRRRRDGAFVVDWTAGEVRLLDSASPLELLTFVRTTAPRLQALQVRMEQQQTRQRDDVERVRVRIGATVKYNDHDTSFWDDPQRTRSAAYVNPDEVEQCLRSLLRAALLYRWVLRGQQLRIVAPGAPYAIDHDALEVRLPANFAEYNWLHAHATFERIERAREALRRFWWFWFALLIVVVGDVDVL